MERAALPQVIPLVEIDNELRISVMSVRAVNIELEKSPVSRVMVGFLLERNSCSDLSEDQKPFMLMCSKMSSKVKMFMEMSYLSSQCG